MSVNNPEQLLEIGKLYCERGDYAVALPNLQKAAQGFLENKKFELYFKTLQLALRAHAEREEFDEVSSIKEKLHDLVLRENIEMTSRMYYTLGLCSSTKGQIENAMEYLKKALELGLKSNHQEDICYAIIGLAICYWQDKKFEEALREIYNLNIFLQVLNIPELRVSSYTVNAMILSSLKKHEQALEVYWMAYDELKNTKQLSLAVSVLGNIGMTLFDMGQRDMAKVYLNLANKSLDPENNKRALKRIKTYLGEYQLNSSDSADLVFDLDNHTILERNLGKIDFKNQFILLDLLKLFISRQGEIFTKEYLVEHVWKQNYNPEVHDNKIYVTIKRLRKMIEPDYDKPKYIFRAKNGYYLNKATKIQMIETNTEGAQV
ncbi:MAG: winged helix-turn-helix domain-containing protein [Bdellovibrionaceae bacterium]|nr:winged helix-turn-helix domain-containing protein [Pseudobdellovibrionaceae bacterium]